MKKNGKKAEEEQVITTVTEQIEDTIDSPVTKREPLFEVVPSGSDVFDCVLAGGYPFGRIVNLVGDKSAGKTLLSSEAVAKARKKYGDKLKWYYDDAEVGYAFNSMTLYGFEIFHENQDSGSYTLEEFEASLDAQLDALEEDEYLIYVLDSLDSLTTEEEIALYAKRKKALAEGKDAPGSYNMDKQKKLSSFFRMMRKKIGQKKCLLIITSQVRANIGVMFGAKYVRMGGKALDHYASQIIWLAEAEKNMKKGRAVGVTTKAKTTKNKMGLPFRECFVNILFDYGVDNISTNLDFLYDLKTDAGKSKGNERLNWDGTMYTPKALISHIEKNNLEEELTKRVKDKWNSIEDEISQIKGRKKK